MGKHHSTDTADIIFLLLSLCPIPQVQLDTLQSWSKYFYSFFLANLSLNICTFFLVWFGPWIYFGQWAKHTVSCYDFLWKHFFFFLFFFFWSSALFLRQLLLLKILFVVTCTVISSSHFDIHTFFQWNYMKKAWSRIVVYGFCSSSICITLRL